MISCRKVKRQGSSKGGNEKGGLSGKARKKNRVKEITFLTIAHN